MIFARRIVPAGFTAGLGEFYPGKEISSRRFNREFIGPDEIRKRDEISIHWTALKTFREIGVFEQQKGHRPGPCLAGSVRVEILCTWTRGGTRRYFFLNTGEII